MTLLRLYDINTPTAAWLTNVRQDHSLKGDLVIDVLYMPFNE